MNANPFPNHPTHGGALNVTTKTDNGSPPRVTSSQTLVDPGTVRRGEIIASHAGRNVTVNHYPTQRAALADLGTVA